MRAVNVVIAGLGLWVVILLGLVAALGWLPI
jgi:hypothetical protein